VTSLLDTGKTITFFTVYPSLQIKSSNCLATLYSTSTMEHHHFDQCLMILNTKGNQILGNLSQVNRKKILNLMELSFEKNIEY
jgi:hypothetical protein